MNNENLQDERRFNHALYHLVYHWAAYIATFVLLMILGTLTVITPILPTKAWSGDVLDYRDYFF